MSTSLLCVLLSVVGLTSTQSLSVMRDDQHIEQRGCAKVTMGTRGRGWSTVEPPEVEDATQGVKLQ